MSTLSKIFMKSEMIPNKSMIDIPLCRMVSLQVVRHVPQINIDKMKANFIHEYQPRAIVFYVLTTKFLSQERMVLDEEKGGWFFN